MTAAEVATLLAGLTLSLTTSAVGLWLARRLWPRHDPDDPSHAPHD